MSTQHYETLDPKATGSVSAVVAQFKTHACLLWLCMPALVVAQNFIPGTEPSCVDGYSNVAALAITALLVAHHIFAEVKAWAATKALLTAPELTIMRHLGVLRRRKFLLILGVLEDVGLYFNLLFPFVARSCNLQVTAVWADSWRSVPVVGKVMAWVVLHLRFWGVTTIVVSFLLLMGLIGFARLILSQEDDNNGPNGDEGNRVAGGAFFTLAGQADASSLPCVAHLCEEMALQRRWRYDAKDNESGGGGTLAAQEARKAVTFGRMPKEYLQLFEVTNGEEADNIASAGRNHFLFVMLVKVLLANAIMFWAQATFFMLAFDRLGDENKAKLIAGMVICGLTMFVRSSMAATKLGLLGVALAIVVLIIAAWAVAAVQHAFQCPSHVWSVAHGCIKYNNHTHSYA
jgi:hypothetical protein